MVQTTTDNKKTVKGSDLFVATSGGLVACGIVVMLAGAFQVDMFATAFIITLGGIALDGYGMYLMYTEKKAVPNAVH